MKNIKEILKNSVAVVPVHNAADYAKATLEWIINNHPELYLIVVDDHSSVETHTTIKNVLEKHPIADNYQLIVLEKQQLFTRAVNTGIRAAHKKGNFDYCFIVNSDCMLKENGFEELLKPFINDKDMGLTGYTDSPQYSDEEFTLVESPHFVTGHFMCIKFEVFKKVGVFCETDLGGPFTNYPEFSSLKGLAHIGSDRYFSNLIRIYGYKTAYVNFPGVEHRAGQSWGHRLDWLSSFNLELLWEPYDTL